MCHLKTSCVGSFTPQGFPTCCCGVSCPCVALPQLQIGLENATVSNGTAQDYANPVLKEIWILLRRQVLLYLYNPRRAVVSLVDRKMRRSKRERGQSIKTPYHLGTPNDPTTGRHADGIWGSILSPPFVWVHGLLKHYMMHKSTKINHTKAIICTWSGQGNFASEMRIRYTILTVRYTILTIRYTILTIRYTDENID